MALASALILCFPTRRDGELSDMKPDTNRKTKAGWIPAHKPIYLPKYEQNPFEHSSTDLVTDPLSRPPIPGTLSTSSYWRSIAPIIVGVGVLLTVIGLIYFTPAKTINVTINSTSGWQATGVVLNRNSMLYVDYISGGWTVDANIYGIIGPEGYSFSVDRQIWGPSRCKILQSAPYGALVGRIGNGPVFEIGKNKLVWFPSDGELFLSINDTYECSRDNQGQVTVRIVFR